MSSGGRSQGVAPDQPMRGQSAIAPSTNSNTTPRRKRQYSPGERAEVAETRRRGACEACRRRKTKCKHTSGGSEVSSNVTSASGSTLSDVSFRTDGSISEPRGFGTRIVSEDLIEWPADKTDSFQDYLSNQVDMRTGTAASKPYKDAARNFELTSSRPKPHELTQQSRMANSSFQPKLGQAVPESWHNGCIPSMEYPVATKARATSNLLGYPEVPAQARTAAPNVPMSHASYQARQPQLSQLYRASDDRQHVQVDKMRNSVLPQSSGSRPTKNMQQSLSSESFASSQQGRAKPHYTEPVSGLVGDTVYPTVLGFVQQEQPGMDSNQRPTDRLPHRSSIRPQQFSTSKGNSVPFPNDRLALSNQMQTFPESVTTRVTGTQSMLQTAAFGPMPAAKSSIVSRTSGANLSFSASSRPLINGDSETRDRLRERQNMPIRPSQHTGAQGQQPGYPPVAQTPRPVPATYAQPSPLWQGGQVSQRPSSDPSWQKSCEMCRRNWNPALGYMCYH